ncbi:arylsulfatase B-like, partial [Teleopsis dalmanni]|uniref:arylsulfatase B-like n=1 Tax=Teleopsis dalmanni TaxID=139649 RepID=UPI0018CD7305
MIFHSSTLHNRICYVSASCVLFIVFVFFCAHLANATETGKATTVNTQREYDDNEKYAQKSEQLKRESTKPNIVIILIDDMGFNDVSFHGSNQILTPNIDALAYNGILLNRHYVPNLCTPSRASLLTGKYPIHTGTQHSVIINDEPWGLPLNETLMPEIFRNAGYSTNLVGKWHLGFWKKEFTPTMRGFDHHFGYYSGYIDYYDHTLHMLDRNYSIGLDFRRNLKPSRDLNGVYATDAFTKEAVRVIKEHNTKKPLFLVMSHLAVHTGNEDNPMQAPDEEVEKFIHISDKKRRTYAGMISSLDNSVAKTMKALSEKGILNNTIVLIYSDNGAPTVGIHSNGGSNYPFRGQKESPWEGGVRSAAALYSPLLKQTSYVSNQLVHAIDWLPTLATAAGIKLPQSLKLDGLDMWNALNLREEPQPRAFLHVLDDIYGYSSYMRDGYKYINGSSFNGAYDGWLGDIAFDEEDPSAPYYVQEVLSSEVQDIIGGRNLTIAHIEAMRSQATHRCPQRSEDFNQTLYRCEPLKAPCLFNIDNDPCERYNLAQLEPEKLQELADDIEAYRLTAVPSARRAIRDVRCNPANFNGTWEWWGNTGNTGTSLSTFVIMINLFLS